MAEAEVTVQPFLASHGFDHSSSFGSVASWHVVLHVVTAPHPNSAMKFQSTVHAFMILYYHCKGRLCLCL